MLSVDSDYAFWAYARPLMRTHYTPRRTGIWRGRTYSRILRAAKPGIVRL